MGTFLGAQPQPGAPEEELPPVLKGWASPAVCTWLQLAEQEELSTG